MGSGQGGFRLATHGAKVPVQLAVGTSGWAMFVHQPLGAFDFTGEGRRVRSAAAAESALPLDVFVIGATEPAAVMSEYAKITGLPEMVPLWSFGYQQSHRTLDSPEQIIQEAKIFREKKLPCDMMIYLGTDFCPNGWNTHNGEFTWNEKAFPNPKEMVQQLHDLNFKVVLHTVVEGRHFSGTVKDPCTAEPIPSGRLADGRTWPPDRAGAVLLAGAQAAARCGRRWLVARSGRRLRRSVAPAAQSHVLRRPPDVPAQRARVCAASQRLCRDGAVRVVPVVGRRAIHVGDVEDARRRWASTPGLSGIPYWGTDIGGFVPTQDFTGELYARWFQFAAFNPLFRSHGREWRLRLPWGWNRGEIGGFRETPSYNPDPKELHNAAIEPICKKYLELRYQMMPYLYSAVKETCETGHADHSRAVAALPRRCRRGRARRRVSVRARHPGCAGGRERAPPRDRSICRAARGTTSGRARRVEGGREITRKVDLETIPVYVRAGAVIPMGPVKQYTGEKVDGPVDAVGASRRGRRVLAVRGRRQRASTTARVSSCG